MDAQFRHRGRVLSAEDVALIRALVAAHHEASRRALSKKLCQAWGWVQLNGQLRDMVCRSLILELHRSGFIELPAVRHLGPRDRFTCWSPQARPRNLHLLACDSRFLIFPWVEVPHLASHLLGRIAEVLPGE